MNANWKFAANVAACLAAPYRLRDGSFVRGQSVSFLLSEMRDRGWRNLGSLGDFEDRCVAAGFRIVEGQLDFSERGGWVGRRGRFARVVCAKPGDLRAGPLAMWGAR